MVEEGNHYALLAQGGLYARLWAHQSGGFLGEDVDDARASPASDLGGDLEPFVDSFFGGARRGRIADDMAVDGRAPPAHRRVRPPACGPVHSTSVSTFSMTTASPLLMCCRYTLSESLPYKPHVGEHSDPELVQRRRGLIPHVERQASLRRQFR